MRLYQLPTSILLISASSHLASAIFTTHADSGLTIEHTKPLTCNRRTQAGDEILVDYRGTLQSDGEEFDSSYNRGVPFSFRLGKGNVIKGWDEGLLEMCVGEERKLIIPPKLGYGNRNMGPIPAGSTLIFETTLVGVIGVSKEETEGHATMLDVPVEDEQTGEADGPGEEVGFPAADIPPVDFIPPTTADGEDEHDHPQTHNDRPPPPPTGHDDDDHPPPPPPDDDENPLESVFAIKKNECRLLGPFALIVQGALGLLALLSLVFKRWRERPRRPLKVWFFDASKQVVGTFLLHLANLAMSMFSSGSFEVMHKAGKELADQAAKDGGHQPNPCSFYLLNLAIDTTIGIPILVILLRVLHVLFLRTPLANPPESIKSGHYGSPPRFTWWIKQSLIYFIGLMGMKLFVLFLFAALPWLGWVGDWALRWTEGNESLQIAFVMFLFPVAMNACQYYVIDAFIKEKVGDGQGEQGFERVAQQDEDEDDDAEVRRGRGAGEDDEDDSDLAEEQTLVAEEVEDGKKATSSLRET